MEEIDTQRIEKIRKRWKETASGPSEDWRLGCEIILKYMPPYPTKDTKPSCVVRHKPTGVFLRYSKGPHQHHFWDIYGDDYLNEGLATLALGEAEDPFCEVPFLLHTVATLMRRLEEKKQ